MASLGAASLRGYCERVGHPPPLRQTLPCLAAVHWAHLCSVPFENLSLQLGAAGTGVSTDLSAVYSKLVLSRRGGALARFLHAPRQPICSSSEACSSPFTLPLPPAGYCFEQNGLLSAALRGAGFDVLDTAARVVQARLNGSGGVGCDLPAMQPTSCCSCPRSRARTELAPLPPRRTPQPSDAAASEVEEAPPLRGPPPPDALDVRQPAVELRLSGHDHHVLIVRLEGRLWLADVGFGGEGRPRGRSSRSCATLPACGLA